MEKQKVTREDYEFLWRVVSLEHALIVSSADPVVLRSAEEGADFDMGFFGGMYYDVCEDEKRARKTMLKRIELAEGDIREHFRLHKECLNSFLAMDGAIITDNRDVFSENCESLCESALGYVELVRSHREKFGSKSFLIYPCCALGHYFHVLNGPYVKTCSFNEAETYFLAETKINGIKERIVDFKIRQDKLPYISLPLHEQEGAGLLLADFSRNLKTNKLLLERAGLEL